MTLQNLLRWVAAVFMWVSRAEASSFSMPWAKTLFYKKPKGCAKWRERSACIHILTGLSEFPTKPRKLPRKLLIQCVTGSRKIFPPPAKSTFLWDIPEPAFMKIRGSTVLRGRMKTFHTTMVETFLLLRRSSSLPGTWSTFFILL
ncbi:hypothetical protein ES707_22669 [subsurface metagenome]